MRSGNSAARVGLIKECAVIVASCLVASCASSLPNSVQDKRPDGNAGLTLKDLSENTWIFESTRDPMTGIAGYSASIWSTTTVQLAYPYQGNQRLTLKVGRAPQGGSYAVVGIVKGQFNCYKCDIRIKFDREDALLFTANSSSEVSGLLFIAGPDRFIEKLQSSKRIAIEAPLFNTPKKIVEFKSEGFPW